MLKISRLPSGGPEIFRSIQGEGVTCGTPCVFVRLALCNLACTWCDTKYTWDWAAYDVKTSVVAMEAAEVVHRVVELAGSDRPDAVVNVPRGYAPSPQPSPASGEARSPSPLAGKAGSRSGPGQGVTAPSTRYDQLSSETLVRNVVVTGGEPLLQSGPLGQLVERLKASGFRIEVETNGTLTPDGQLGAAVDQWNVSPKLASSGNAGGVREVAGALGWFVTSPAAYFKLVVVEEKDLDEIGALASRYGIHNDRILLMPEGTTAQVLEERSAWLVERCVERGYRFSPRLHIMLWGDRRGR